MAAHSDDQRLDLLQGIRDIGAARGRVKQFTIRRNISIGNG
jgi:hypothetical protein